MNIPATFTTYTEIESSLDIDYSILNSRIFTTRDISQYKLSTKKNKSVKYLCISIEINLENFESTSDGSAFARPRLLIILGLISFLSNELFTPFRFHGISTSVGSLTKTKKSKFRVNNISLLKDLRKITNFLNSSNENSKRLFYSLLDRWRKAFYLEIESEENMIHNDEVLLSHFHILELLSDSYKPKQKDLAANAIDNFTKNFLKEIYLLDGSSLDSELSSKKKLIESLFIPTLPVTSKVLFMLKEQNLLNDRLKYLISEIVKDRNSVAHGRKVYKDKVIFPVPPFFALTNTQVYTAEMLRILTGRTISIFININHLKDEWEDLNETLLPTYNELITFINEKKYAPLSIEEFYEGKENDITPFVISYYLTNKKLKPNTAIPALSELILNYRKIEDEIIQLIIPVLLVVDNLKGKEYMCAIEIIILASDNGWVPYFKMRDILYYLEYLGHKPKTLRDMIIDKKIK